MGLKVSNNKCPRSGRPCRGMLRDTILDWEDELPLVEQTKSEKECKEANLCVCLGTSLQIFPVASMPFLCKSNRKTEKGRVVIVNLQSTPMDKKADLVIHEKTDRVMEMLMNGLNMVCPSYSIENDLIIQSEDKLIEY